MQVYGNTVRKGNAKRKTVRPVLLPGAGKTVQQSRRYVNIVIMVAAVVVALAFLYITEQSDVTNLRKQKGQMISQYEDIKLSNDLYYEDIVSRVDIKEIERIAVEELGMKMAGQGQIYTYTDDVEDYVKQYADLPD